MLRARMKPVSMTKTIHSLVSVRLPSSTTTYPGQPGEYIHT
jgi:hypothetical protein